MEDIAERAVIVARQSHLEAKAVCNLVCLEHCSLATLVNGDDSLLEPSLLLQVSLEGCKEAGPQLAVLG